MREKFPAPSEFLNEANEDYLKWFSLAFERKYGKGSFEREVSANRETQEAREQASTVARVPSDFFEVASSFKHHWNSESHVGILERNGKYIGVCVLAAKEITDGENYVRKFGLSFKKDIQWNAAASRLWEGVNLNRLKFLIIDALPYGSPQPYDKFEKNVWSSWRTSRTFRFMIRRLQQGVGRLIRSDQDPWGIVVVIDGRFNAQWNTIRTALPKYMSDLRIIQFVTRGQIKSAVLEKVSELEKSTKH